MKTSPVVAVAALLLAAPAQARTAMVALDPEVLAAAGLEAKGFRIVEVTKEFDRLQGDSLIIVMPDEPAPSWTDTALRQDWTSGTAGCRYKVGAPPYAGNIKALSCGQDLAQALWQRHLERIDADGVVLYGSVRKSPTSREFHASAGGYRVDEAQSRGLAGTAKTRAEAVRMAADYLVKILAGEGEARPRVVIRQLPEAPAGSSAASQVARYRAVPVPAGCKATSLPRKLELNADSAAANLDRLWTTSTPEGGAPPRACALAYKSSEASVADMRVFLSEASLRCQAQTFVSKQRGFVVSAVEEKTLQDLVRQAFEAWCK